MEDGHVIPYYSTNFCAEGQQTGLNLTNLKLLKLGNTVEDFGNAMYWRGGAATPSSPASSAQAGLKPGASHVWSKDVTQQGTLGPRVWWKKGSNTTHQTKKNKKGRSSLVLARVQLPLLTAARCVVPHLSVFIWIQAKELEPNQKPGYVPVMVQPNHTKQPTPGRNPLTEVISAHRNTWSTICKLYKELSKITQKLK